MLLLAVLVTGVTVLDTVRELVLGVSHVVDGVVSVFVAQGDLFPGPFHGTVEMSETVSVARRSAFHRHEDDHAS